MKSRQQREKELKCRGCEETFESQEELKAHERECLGEETSSNEDVEGEESTEVNEGVDDLGEPEEFRRGRQKESEEEEEERIDEQPQRGKRERMR